MSRPCNAKVNAFACELDCTYISGTISISNNSAALAIDLYKSGIWSADTFTDELSRSSRAPCSTNDNVDRIASSARPESGKPLTNDVRDLSNGWRNSAASIPFRATLEMGKAGDSAEKENVAPSVCNEIKIDSFILWFLV